MQIPDSLLCMFSAQIDEQDGSYVIELPEEEVQIGSAEAGGTYRVALLTSAAEGGTAGDETIDDGAPTEGDLPEPPVEEGEQRTVEIEDIGEQGDGITRVERGFVVIVPDTEQGERVRVEISEVRQNVAFAEVVERLSYYE